MTVDAKTLLPENASLTLRVMADAAGDAGAILLDAATRRQSLRVEEKTLGDFVSEADRQAEASISTHVRKAFPDYAWLGEESGAHGPGVRDFCWVVDPLDGTTNFLKGIPHWAVSIALCRGEEVIAGLVFDPAKGELFSAERGSGAFLNGAPMQISDGVDMSAALFATGVPAGGRTTYLEKCVQDIQRLMPLCAGIRRGGAAALDLAYVAAGRLEGYWERNLGPWDVAAGVLLVREARGQVEPLWKGRGILSSGSFVASNAELHDQLSAQLDREP